MKTVILWMIGLYRRIISPMKPPCCRFYPTCSAYALEAISVHGVIRGGFLALKRILKCHPFHLGGVNLVPPRAGQPAHAEQTSHVAEPSLCCDHTILQR